MRSGGILDGFKMMVCYQRGVPVFPLQLECQMMKI